MASGLGQLNHSTHIAVYNNKTDNVTFNTMISQQQEANNTYIPTDKIYPHQMSNLEGRREGGTGREGELQQPR